MKLANMLSTVRGIDGIGGIGGSDSTRDDGGDRGDGAMVDIGLLLTIDHQCTTYASQFSLAMQNDRHHSSVTGNILAV